MWQLTRIELFKIFRKPRTYIAFGAVAALVFLIQFALYVDGDEYLDFVMQSFNETFVVEGRKLNGYFVCYTILQTLLIHVPLLIALVAGDMLAGEANMGTLRLLASKPISRSELILSKFLATTIYTLALLVFMALLGLFGSMLLFGTDDLLILKSDMVVLLQKHDIFWRYLYAFGFAALAMTTVASLAFFFSVFAENSIGPIIASMAVIILLTIIITMDFPVFNVLKPYLFINHMLNWKGLFDQPVDSSEVLKSAGVLVAHIVIFVSLTWLIFSRKDILS